MSNEPNKPDEAFSRAEQICFEIKRNKYVKAAAKVPWILFLTSLGGVALGVVAYSEWEIVYRVFEALMGEDNRYWSPVLMGLTASTMIVGFHLLAKLKPQNITVRIVENSVGMLIPIYLFGIGILIACILFQEGLSDMLNVEIPDIIGGIPEVVEEGWLDAFFAHVTNPIAVMAFSLGIGGLAIVNIFVAHQLLTMITKNGSDAFDRLTLAKSAIGDHQITKRVQREYAEIGAELDELAMQDDEDIKLMITDEVMSTISDALLPHKKWLQHNQYSSEFRFGVQDQKVDTKQIAKDIAKIEAIRPQDVMNAMNARYLEKKNKMRKLIATIFLCCAAFAAQAKMLTVGVDLSSSNPLLTNKNFAYVASQYVTAQIKQLKKGDVVQIKTFGARGDLSNLPNTVSRFHGGCAPIR